MSNLSSPQNMIEEADREDQNSDDQNNSSQNFYQKLKNFLKKLSLFKGWHSLDNT
jgi:hypothetical protein